ncbi:hypothetical protein EXM22_00145 [Oceanispirochaeta crateris]|uniref:Uncharacterized protein n=1 Tax=Oceanispirochaeta crateris TaxID=2518645 RepID=A0A5C1QEL0_9SPIO|nr:hypothetical protein [Oceanispirochaeta crateris]QEN06475.1 hypothetical protein EXM22_00145 [Oceanispirochaeta crateris]
MNQNNTRITCSLHFSLRETMQNLLSEKPSLSVFFESCRTVRRQDRKRKLSFPGQKKIPVEWPGDRYYITTESSKAEALAAEIYEKVGLDIPGHGSLLMQDISVYEGRNEENPAEEFKACKHQMSQITAILSLPKAGDQLAAIALDYGLGVPVVSLGEGTGLRDSLGLLRITIPPQKEIVHLVVSRYDSDNILKILIEHGDIDRPGGGFVYTTPVCSAHLDNKMVIGRQAHSASIDQMIAAIDELKGDTGWRKRSLEVKKGRVRFTRKQKEITVYCPEGSAGNIADCAMNAGAKGATLSRVQHLAQGEKSGNTAAWERVVALVPEKISDSITDKIFQYGIENPGKVLTIETLEVQAAFSHA